MIDCLVENSVTIKSGLKNHAIAYQNSLCGRIALCAEQPPEVVAEVMAVWGNEPTVLTN